MRRRLPWLAGMLFLCMGLVIAVYQPEWIQALSQSSEKFFANLLSTYLDHGEVEFQRLDLHRLHALVVIFMAGTLTVSLFAALNQTKAFALFALGFLASLGWVFWTYLQHDLLFNPLHILAFWTGVYLCVAIVKAVCRGVDKKRMRQLFDMKVSSSVLRHVERNPATLDKVDVYPATVLVSEISGFEYLLEQVPVRDFDAFLKRYLAPITRSAMTRKGFVENVDADSVCMVWGVPYPLDNHAAQASESALEQLKIAERMSVDFEKDYQFELKVRIGLSSGNIAAGRMGPEGIKSYEVLGRPRATAVWLRSLCSSYDVGNLISKSTFRDLEEGFVLRHVDRVRGGPVEDALDIYEIAGRINSADPELQKLINLYEDGLEFYLSGDFQSAIAKLQDALAVAPEDGPARLLIKRARELKRNPPETWSGVHEWKLQ